MSPNNKNEASNAEMPWSLHSSGPHVHGSLHVFWAPNHDACPNRRCRDEASNSPVNNHLAGKHPMTTVTASERPERPHM